jgi:hypothetical protein
LVKVLKKFYFPNKLKKLGVLLRLIFLLSFCFSLPSYGQELAPPSYFTAVNDQDGKVPLFWFSPETTPEELFYDDGSAELFVCVDTLFFRNKFAIQFSFSDSPFLLLKSKLFLNNRSILGNLFCDTLIRFELSICEDSSGLPGKILSGPNLVSVIIPDTGQGKWVEVEHNLMFLSEKTFWIVLGFAKDSPFCPLVGADFSANQLHSYWASDKAGYFQWKLCSGFNLMLRAVMVSNEQKESSVDSFLIYRSEQSNFDPNVQNLLTILPKNQFSFVDSNVINGQEYFYKISAEYSEGVSLPSNEVYGLPKALASLSLHPNYFEISLSPSSQDFRILNLTNPGQLPLDFSFEIVLKNDSLTLGQDQFGYSYKRSDQESNFSFFWREIENPGSEIVFQNPNDGNFGPIPLNFSFPFYDSTFNTLRICTNGWLSFTDSVLTYQNQALPFWKGPFNLIAPFWDDFVLGDSGKIYFYCNSDSAMISFVNLARYPSGGPYTFQTIFTKTGEIILNYKKLNSPKSSYTIGIQNQDGSSALTIAYNQECVKDSVTFKILPSWVKCDEMQGRVEPSQTLSLTLNFNSQFLNRGTYQADLVIKGKDKNHNLEPAVIPLTLRVDTVTSVNEDPVSSPKRFSLLQNYPNPFNQSTVILLQLDREEEGILSIYNLKGELVRNLINQRIKSGTHKIVWEGKDSFGNELPSGVYFLVLRLGKTQEVKKIVLLK